MKWVYAPVLVCGWTGASEDIRIPERKTRDRAMYQRKSFYMSVITDNSQQLHCTWIRSGRKVKIFSVAEQRMVQQLLEGFGRAMA